MSSSLSKRWVCCRNLQSFHEQPLLLLWVMRVYIVWVKGKKIALKILQAQSFAGTSQDDLSREVLAKFSLILDISASNMYFSCGLFAETLLTNFLRDSRKTALIFIVSLIFHQLNTKLNTIKSHKIQGTKLMQLHYFLSWNKINIKYSYKSQL